MSMMQDKAPLWDMPDDLPVFTMAMVAPAVGVTANTLRVWFHRKHIVLGEQDRGAQVNGAANGFTLRTVQTLGVTAELVNVGVGTSAAFEIAKAWEMIGDVEGERGAPARREPAGLFPAPYQTYLVVAPENDPDVRRNRAHAYQIIAVDPRDPKAHGILFGALFRGGRAGGRVIWLNMVIARVRSACEAMLHGRAVPPKPDWNQAVSEIILDGVDGN